MINVSGQQFHFPLLRLGKTESATGDPHQRSRQAHLPDCQDFTPTDWKKIKRLKPDLVLALGVQRGLKGSYADTCTWHKTTTETPVFP